MAVGRRQATIGGIMVATAVAAVLLVAPRYVHEPLFWVALIALPWALPWIVAPVALRRNLWQPVDYGHRPFEPSAPDVPEEVADRLRRATDDLQALGFVLRGYFRQTNPASHGIVNHLGLFERPGTWEVAKLMVNTTPRGVHTTLVYQTAFGDGIEIVTGDSAQLPAWPRQKGVLGISFPEIRSASGLYEVHRSRVARHGGMPVRELPPSDDSLVDYLRALTEKNRAWPIAIGFYELDTARGVFRPTWKGTLWNAWGRLPPVGPIRKALRRRRARRTLRELILEGRLAQGADQR